MASAQVASQIQSHFCNFSQIMSHQQPASSSAWVIRRNSSASSTDELPRRTSLQNLTRFLEDHHVITHNDTAFSIQSKIVNIVDIGDNTKLIGFEISKRQESCFENQQFVAVYYNGRKAHHIDEAGTFPIMSIKHNAKDEPVVYIAVRADEPDSMSTFLFEEGRPLLEARLVL